MKPQSFEEFLQDMFMEEEPQLLDDDLPDGFSDWLSTLDVEDFLIYGDRYGKKLTQKQNA